MKDDEIITLFHDRAENAIEQLRVKYGGLCKKIAMNILHCNEDEDECINDALLAFWNSVPPENPRSPKAYLCKLVRNICTKRYHYNCASKRNHSYDMALDEMEEVISSNESLEDITFANDLSKEISTFLDSLEKQQRALFIHRYWYGDSIIEIAEKFHLKQTVVPVQLARIRKKLKKHLEEKGMFS